MSTYEEQEQAQRKQVQQMKNLTPANTHLKLQRTQTRATIAKSIL